MTSIVLEIGQDEVETRSFCKNYEVLLYTQFSNIFCSN